MPVHCSSGHSSPSSHEVQFYEQDSFLIEKLFRYVNEGLVNGESVIIIATPSHRDALSRCFANVHQQDRYIELDATETLAQIMVKEWPDRARFFSVIGKVLQQAANAGNGRIRAFGEMVALLWEKGHFEAALHLESLWNELMTHHTFSILCAYPIGSFFSPDHTHTFQKICSTHSAVMPAETPIVPGPWDSQVTTMTLATLQQKSVALEREVARRHELQLLLRQREEELADFLENAVECVHQVGPDGRILWANKAELTMLGYEPQDYIGHHIEEFHADQPVIQDILKRLTANETLHDYPARLRCKDGSIKDVLIHSNVRWENGMFRYTRCFTRDITERKRNEQELDLRVEERTRDLVESQQKLRALAAELSLAEGRVRKGIATELHDYLAQLLIVTRLKLNQATYEADGQTKLRQMLKEADDALNDSIAYTRTLMAQLNPPILEYGLSKGLRWLAESFGRHDLHVELQMSPSHLELPLSENQIELLFQSVRELLMNVVKHARTSRAWIVLHEEGGALQLEVVDQGKGFHPESVSDQPGGQVLANFGLFSIRERMKILGGQFEVESAPGRGTCARIRLALPASIEERADTAETSIPAAPKNFSYDATDTIHILLVEDHTVVREGLRGVLDNYPDLEVVAEAGDGEEAIAQAERYLPDVIIMDINLPKCDGIEATRRIKSRLPNTIVVGLSVHKPDQIEPALLEAGGTAYVVKDAATVALYRTIVEAVRKARPSSTNSAGTS